MVSNGQRIYGESGAGWLTIIEWDGTSGNAVITISGLQHCIIESINIRRKSGSSVLTSGHGVVFQSNAYFCEVRTCKITETGNGISMSGTGNQVIDCELRKFSGSYGIRYFGTSTLGSFRCVLQRVVMDNSELTTGSTSFIHLDYDSYAYSLIIEACAFLYGGTGVYMHDSAATGSSYPTWIHAFDLECDHQWSNAVVLDGGEGCFITTSWLGSAVNGNGLVTGAGWRGELLLTNSRLYGNGQYGILLNGGVDAMISNNTICDNSALSTNTYSGIRLGTNVSKFAIVGNKIGDGVSGAGNNQAYGIDVPSGSSDYYQIIGNIIYGNGLGFIFDGGTGSNKIVQDYAINGGGLKMTGNLISANIVPLADNLYQLGASGGRWTAVWAVNGTIQTSDPSLKTDISPLPTALPIIQDIDPVTFKWISGGLVPEKRTTRKLLPVLGTEDFTEEDVEETVYVDRPGKRTHWGFLASDVKAAFDKTGLDFGGYVKDEEGVEHLRPDQLIPVLWKAIQELKLEFDNYKKERP